MTSETETLKTNEFLRRRKLRLQQVREQSKDIAKKIRQRAKVETLRQVVNLDAQKQKEYFDRQEKLVQRLELLYSKGLNNVGSSHQSASEINHLDETTKTDLSKLRGKEAVAELRKKRQEKLDEQKKLLDRRLQAREAANELSREKTTAVTNKLLKPSQSGDELSKKNPSTVEVVKDTNQGVESNDERGTAIKTDMGTQWDVDAMPKEWEPAVPKLQLPKDDYDKEDEHTGSRSEKTKRLDLFALSKEMPSYIRGREFEMPEHRATVRPSLTLVSEYLQNRKLRLRNMDAPIKKVDKVDGDIHSLKQTIQRTRATRAEGTPLNRCQVVDKQIVPVPSWHAENTCQYCSKITAQKSFNQTKEIKCVTNSQINRIFRSIRPAVSYKMSGIMPNPILRSTSPYRRNKMYSETSPGKSATEPKPDNELNRKNSVLMYNHNTRDIRDLPSIDEQIVVRDIQSSEDAYSQAMRESEVLHVKDKDYQKKVQDFRTKVAVTKQTVEKEYNDTINFLNSLPKESNKVAKVAYMDEHRRQIQKENRQHKMQQEFRKIEKECRRHHSCVNKPRNKSRSPVKQKDNDFDRRDFQYSWMPVPEGDGNLAVHTIPNTVKEGKTGNTVKFSKVDSYHEYRSRHKHTPPTKDTAHEKQSNKKYVKTVIIDKNASQSSDETSTISNSSSVENLGINKQVKEVHFDHNSSDAERIIIYKILDTKNNKHSKKNNKLLSEIAKSLTSIEKVSQKSVVEEAPTQVEKTVQIKGKPVNNSVSFEQINEGIYKVAEEGDNITSMQTENPLLVPGIIDNHTCRYRQGMNEEPTRVKENIPTWQDEDIRYKRIPERCHCHSSEENEVTPVRQKVTPIPAKHPSTSTSASSFKTAVNDKAAAVTEGGYIKLVDETGHEAGKFYLGPAGLLQDDGYEVVIQVRKKDAQKEGHLSPRHQTSDYSSAEVYITNLNSENIVPIPPNSEAQLLQSANVSESAQKNNVQDDRDNLIVDDNKKEHPPNIDVENTNVNLVISPEDKEDIIENEANLKEYDNLRLKLDNNMPSRPATTTYTQTTNSPIHMPVYIHMSSSTSTAYMSPPEMILPKFLRHDYVMTEDEICGIDDIETARHTKHDKRNKICRHARKSLSDVNLKRVNDKNTNSTPPNTPRCNLTDHLSDDIKRPEIGTPCKKSKISKTQCNCPNCDVRNTSKNRVKKECNKNKNYPIKSKQMSLNLNNRLVNKNVTPKNKYKTTSLTHNKKGSLNSIVRDYVNKLLILNREGLKAIQVADQECSSVGTPGSSIINVPFNVDERKPSIGNTISLEHIKKSLLEQIVKDNLKSNLHDTQGPVTLQSFDSKQNSYLPRKLRKKPVHKVKSFNISKHLLKQHKHEATTQTKKGCLSTTTDDNNRTLGSSIASKSRPRSSPSSRQTPYSRPLPTYKQPGAKEINKKETKQTYNETKTSIPKRLRSPCRKQKVKKKEDPVQCPSYNSKFTDTSPDSELTKDSRDYYKTKPDIPICISTQTSQNNDSDFVKLAEDKLHNMEKIADLTEKCTIRLSNLAKVLEEVRKNKSLVYSQISGSDSTESQSDQKSDNAMITPVPIDPIVDLPNSLDLQLSEPLQIEHSPRAQRENANSEFVSYLLDIPESEVFQVSQPEDTTFKPIHDAITNVKRSLPTPPLNADTMAKSEIIKCRPKPPAALTRIHLKHGQDRITPHELSTVLEVDSPLSVKSKTQSSHNEVPSNGNANRSQHEDRIIDQLEAETDDPDLLQCNLEKVKVSSTEPSSDAKFQMIDLKQFNEIMLEPFISIHEYAKKYNIETPDEGSNIEELQKDDAVNDDMSSLHSDGSLPDVIAELLKRNIIAEPFKFDSISNVNSNTFSSESSLSMLALSKARKVKKRSNVMFQNKENVGETSDTLSISSNPDLEHAFKKLGMGWASSTLKKTKERLALSSSSNTSSSSLQFKIKSFNQDIPALVTDSVSSVLLSKKRLSNKNDDSANKNAEQQTSFANSMIVKEYLANELANKITFTSNKSSVNDTEDEFISLFETKMPEGLRQQTLVNREDQSSNNDSIPGGVNRARTSTPVQLFRSMTYHSTSSSNISNGLFSNVDDLSSVKMTSNSMKNHSTSDKDDLTIPNFSLKMKKGSDCSKSD